MINYNQILKYYERKDDVAITFIFRGQTLEITKWHNNRKTMVSFWYPTDESRLIDHTLDAVSHLDKDPYDDDDLIESEYPDLYTKD